jgi:hypothetical protein
VVIERFCDTHTLSGVFSLRLLFNYSVKLNCTSKTQWVEIRIDVEEVHALSTL